MIYQENSTLIEYTTKSYLSVIKYECKENYEAKSREKILTFNCSYYNNERKWLPDTDEDCSLINCYKPPEIEGSYFDQSAIETTINSTLTYKCKPEFTIQGNPNITCEKTGDWTIPPFCKSKSF